MPRACLYVLILQSFAAFGQYDPKAPLTRETILLARVRTVAWENARRIPDFTCGMTVERSLRRARSGRFEPSDTLRLEVAFAEGKEMYAWPGAKRFEASDITALVGTGGAIGTGDFTSHVQSVLLSDSPTITYAGEEPMNGHETHRFDYVVERARSKYFMRIPPVEAAVGYQGSFWIDRQSMDVVRLVVEVNDVPASIPVRFSRKTIDLERQLIGDTRFLLPTGSEMEIQVNDGTASLNRTRFLDCHQFRGDSSVSFEDPPPDAPEKPGLITTTLPAGMKLNLALAKPVDLKAAARGDQIFLQSTKESRTKDGFTVPRGAEFTGRLDLLECPDAPLPMCYLMLHLESFRFANKEGSLRAELEAPVFELQNPLQGNSVRRSGRILIPAEIITHPADRGVLSIRGGRQTLTPGFGMVWRVLPPN